MVLCLDILDLIDGADVACVCIRSKHVLAHAWPD